MKIRCFFAIFIFFAGISMAIAQTTSVQAGEELVLVVPEDGTFSHVDVPRKNIIIKRGWIADMKSLDGNRVIVSEVLETPDGTEVVLKRKDGRKFFRSFPTLTAQWPAVLESEELVPAR